MKKCEIILQNKKAKSLISRWVVIGYFLLFSCSVNAQPCGQFDYKKKWYSNVPSVYISEQDTLTLFDTIDSINAESNILRWEYLNGRKFKPVYSSKEQGTIVQPAYMRIIKWKLKGDVMILKCKGLKMKYYIYCESEKGRAYKLVLIKQTQL